jgi:hypothetical protein
MLFFIPVNKCRWNNDDITKKKHNWSNC